MPHYAFGCTNIPFRAALAESDPQAREERLISWQRAPAARIAHPHEDHLIPLMVAAGAAESETAHRIYHEHAFFGGVAVSSYRFGSEVARAGAEFTLAEPYPLRE